MEILDIILFSIPYLGPALFLFVDANITRREAVADIKRHMKYNKELEAVKNKYPGNPYRNHGWYVKTKQPVNSLDENIEAIQKSRVKMALSPLWWIFAVIWIGEKIGEARAEVAEVEKFVAGEKRRLEIEAAQEMLERIRKERKDASEAVQAQWQAAYDYLEAESKKAALEQA